MNNRHFTRPVLVNVTVRHISPSMLYSNDDLGVTRTSLRRLTFVVFYVKFSEIAETG